jgi:hypothetical protein
MSFTPQQLSEIVADFPNDGKRHHHTLIRHLAKELLQAKLEGLMLRTTLDGIHEEAVRRLQEVPFVADCDEEVA